MRKLKQPGTKKRLNVLEKRMNSVQGTFLSVQKNLERMLEAHGNMVDMVKDQINKTAIVMSIMKMLQDKGIWTEEELKEFLECQLSAVNQEESPDTSGEMQEPATPTLPETPQAENEPETEPSPKDEQ